MGTPEKQRNQVVLEPPTIAEKIRMLETGKSMKTELGIKNLSTVIETAKEIILPLVRELDKPIFPTERDRKDVPEEFWDKRGLCLLSSTVMEIWLQRSGKWLLYSRNGLLSGEIDEEGDSEFLAKNMFHKMNDFLGRYRCQRILKELSFFEGTVIYNVILLKTFEQFFKNVKDLIEGREERLQIMRSRLNLLDDFTQSLDPVASSLEKTEIEIFEIWKETTRGARNEIKPYLNQKAIDPFWKHIEEKYSEELPTYKQHVFKITPKTLDDFLDRIGFFCDDITTAKSYGRTNVEEIFRFSSGRLPFTEDELVVLKELTESLTK